MMQKLAFLQFVLRQTLYLPDYYRSSPLRIGYCYLYGGPYE